VTRKFLGPALVAHVRGVQLNPAPIGRAARVETQNDPTPRGITVKAVEWNPRFLVGELHDVGIEMPPCRDGILIRLPRHRFLI
jgi:hypothetical protein